VSSGDGFWIRSLAETHPAGGRIPRHQHAWGQLAYAISGVMHIETPSALWITPPTRAVWIPPGRPHEITMQGATAMRTLYISPAYAERLPDDEAVFEVAPLLRELILHILKIGMLGPGEPAHERLAGVVIDLLLVAGRQDLALPLPRDRRARAMAERLQAEPAASASLEALARQAGASLRTLQRLFPQETGLTLEAWRQKARLAAAVALLSTGAPVALAAADCGYESPSAFISAFKRHFRVTPGRYRAALSPP
jgi:AraC-like DNA-binding protein